MLHDTRIKNLRETAVALAVNKGVNYKKVF